MVKPEEFLNLNVKGILQPMVKEILAKKPQDPVTKYILIMTLSFL